MYTVYTQKLRGHKKCTQKTWIKPAEDFVLCPSEMAFVRTAKTVYRNVNVCTEACPQSRC